MRRTTSGAKKRTARGRAKNAVASTPRPRLARVAEDAEDRRDAEDGRRALAEARAKGEKPVPWTQVKAELGL